MRKKLILMLGAGCLVTFFLVIQATPTTDPSTSIGSLTPAAKEPPDLGTYKKGSDWTRFLGARADNKSTETGLFTNWAENGPPILWTKDIGRGYSMVSVARGRLLLFDRKEGMMRLHCLHSETGEELWTSEYPTEYEGTLEPEGGPVATPVIDHDRVYTYDIAGRLRSHHVVDGELLWDVDTMKQFDVKQNLYGVGSTPWIEDDLLIVMVGGRAPRPAPSSPGSPQEEDGIEKEGSGIVAFDKYTGEVRYSITDERASYSSPLVADIHGRRQGLAFTQGGLVGFEPRAGEIDFFFPWKDPRERGVNAIMPVVVEDTVFISEAYGPGGVMLRLKPEGGDPEVVWKDPRGRRRYLSSHWSTPIYHEGYLYGPSGRTSEEAELRCVEHATGKVMWSEPDLKLVNLLYVDGHFIVVSEFGRILLIEATPERFHAIQDVNLFEPRPEYPWSMPVDPASSTPPIARQLLRYPVWNVPVLSHGLLYVRGWTKLVVFDLRPAAGRPS